MIDINHINNIIKHYETRISEIRIKITMLDTESPYYYEQHRQLMVMIKSYKELIVENKKILSEFDIKKKETLKKWTA